MESPWFFIFENYLRQNPESEIYTESSRFVQLAFSVDKPQKDVQEMMRRDLKVKGLRRWLSTAWSM